MAGQPNDETPYSTTCKNCGLGIERRGNVWVAPTAGRSCTSGDDHVPLVSPYLGRYILAGLGVLFVVAVIGSSTGDSDSDGGGSINPRNGYTETECASLRLVALDDSNRMEVRQDALFDYKRNCE